MAFNIVALNILALCLFVQTVTAQTAYSPPEATNGPRLWLMDERSESNLKRILNGVRIDLSTYRGKQLNIAATAPTGTKSVKFLTEDGYARRTSRRPFLLFPKGRSLERRVLKNGGVLTLTVHTCIGECLRSTASSTSNPITATFFASSKSGSVKPIPGLNNWSQKMISYGRKHCLSLTDGSANGLSLLANTYYDAQRVFQQIRDYTHDASWQPCIDAAKHVYRDLYVRDKNGMVPGYWNFSAGLAYDYLETRDQESKDAVNLLARNAAFASDETPIETLHGWEYSREAALTILSYLDAEKVGFPRRARLSQLASTALGHLQQWFISREARYVKSFMVGLTTVALIEYQGRTGDRRILPAITHALDELWDLNWVDANSAFKYTNVLNPGDETTTPAPDLNQIIAPAFAWAYYQTGELRFRDRGDRIFQGGVELGYSAGIKQFNQLYRWSFDYVRWRSLRPLR